MLKNIFKLDKSEAPYLCDEDFKLAFKANLKTLQVDLSFAQFFGGDKNYRSAAISFNAALCYTVGVSSMEEYYKRYGHKVQRLILVNTRTITEFPYEGVLKFCQQNPIEVLDMRNLNYYEADAILSLPEYFNASWINESQEVYQKLRLILLPKTDVLPKRENNNCFSLAKRALNLARYVKVSNGLMYFGTIDIPGYISIQGITATYLNDVYRAKVIWEVDYLLLQKQICMQEMGKFLKESNVASIQIDFAEFKENSCGAVMGIHDWPIRYLAISGRMKRIKKGVFTDLKNLEYLKIHTGVEEIEDFSFDGCPKLKTIELPEKLNLNNTFNPSIRVKYLL